eukprot:6434614-Alexandrium_andersonii.AAC.1
MRPTACRAGHAVRTALYGPPGYRQGRQTDPVVAPRDRSSERQRLGVKAQAALPQLALPITGQPPVHPENPPGRLLDVIRMHAWPQPHTVGVPCERERP